MTKNNLKIVKNLKNQEVESKEISAPKKEGIISMYRPAQVANTEVVAYIADRNTPAAPQYGYQQDPTTTMSTFSSGASANNMIYGASGENQYDQQTGGNYYDGENVTDSYYGDEFAPDESATQEIETSAASNYDYNENNYHFPHSH